MQLLSNQKCLIQPALIDLHPNKYGQKFVGSCNTVILLSVIVSYVLILLLLLSVSNKTDGLNLNVFNMITGINESKTLTKHISCERNCRFDRRKYSSDQSWNNGNVNVSVKKHHICEKDYVWNPNTCTC